MSALAAQPGPHPRLSRRRAIKVVALAAGLPFLGTPALAPGIALYRWRGSSLGSPTEILVCHSDPGRVQQAIRYCSGEISRLEGVFALYQPDSEVARLNRMGELEQPSFDLLTVLSLSLRLSALTQGAFDISVQPLWDLYAAHFFGRTPPEPGGPDPAALARARTLVDWQQIALGRKRVRLARAGMAVTLNGIAQGYVADRITGILRNCGFGQLLINLGCSEVTALGRHPDGRPWRIGLASPQASEQIGTSWDLSDRALCTSAGYGTKFEPTGRFHHLFDPVKGTSANAYVAVSVAAASGMVADALSTALYVLAPEHAPRIAAEFADVRALLTHADGRMQEVQS